MSRANGELTAYAQSLGLDVRIRRKWAGCDVSRESGLDGFYAIEVGFDHNPKPEAEEIYLGKNIEASRKALLRQSLEVVDARV